MCKKKINPNHRKVRIFYSPIAKLVRHRPFKAGWKHILGSSPSGGTDEISLKYQKKYLWPSGSRHHPFKMGNKSSNLLGYTINIGVWCNGSISDSKSLGKGSNPFTSAKIMEVYSSD